MAINDDELLFQRDELSTGWTILAKRYIVSVAEVKARYKFLIEDEIIKEKEKNAGESTCLKCRKKFLSEHKVNIRTCPSCKILNNEMAANMAEAVRFGQ